MYTVALYDDMLGRIRATVPEVAVSSDFIVGFCGETEASFEKSVRLVERAPVQEQLHLQVQPAAGHEGRHALRRRRARGGQAAAEQRAAGRADGDQPRGQPRVPGPDCRGAGRRAEQVGGPARGRGDAGSIGQLTGRTACDRIVVFDGPERLIGQFLPVRIEDASAVTLFGQVVTTESNGVEPNGIGIGLSMGKVTPRGVREATWGASSTTWWVVGSRRSGSIPAWRRRRPRSTAAFGSGPDPCRPAPTARDRCLGGAARRDRVRADDGGAAELRGRGPAGVSGAGRDLESRGDRASACRVDAGPGDGAHRGRRVRDARQRLDPRRPVGPGRDRVAGRCRRDRAAPAPGARRGRGRELPRRGGASDRRSDPGVSRRRGVARRSRPARDSGAVACPRESSTTAFAAAAPAGARALLERLQEPRLVGRRRSAGGGERAPRAGARGADGRAAAPRSGP